MASSIKSVISCGESDLGISTGTKSFTCSKKYIREVLKYYVINIIYHRINLPEDEFEEVNVQDIKLMKSKRSSKHPVIYKYNGWMKGAIHALERNFLKEFQLLIKNTDGALLEFYNFKFYYNLNGADKENLIDLYQETKKLFEDIKLLTALNKWDENNDITSTIKYNENVAPFYEAPYYVNRNPTDEADDEDEQAIKKIKERIKVFNISTGFHAIKCVVGTDNTMSPYALTTLSSMADEEENGKQSNDKESLAPTHESVNSISSSSSDTEIITKEKEICICQTTINHEALKLVHCITCQKPFHCVCFGFLGAPKVDFKCVDCGGTTNIPGEINFTAEQILSFSRMRLLIGFCNLTMQIPDKIMTGFQNVQERNRMWKKLVDLKVVMQKNEKYVVNRSALTEIIVSKGLFCKQIDHDSMQMMDLTEEYELISPPVKKMKC